LSREEEEPLVVRISQKTCHDPGGRGPEVKEKKGTMRSAKIGGKEKKFQREKRGKLAPRADAGERATHKEKRSGKKGSTASMYPQRRDGWGVPQSPCGEEKSNSYLEREGVRGSWKNLNKTT